MSLYGDASHRGQANELHRIEAVQRYRTVVSAEDRVLQTIARLASRLVQSRAAYIAVVDAQAERCLAAWGESMSDIPRDLSLSGQAVAAGEPVAVQDARLDPRFSMLPWVSGAPRVRSCAAAPLVTRDDQSIGAVCVLDYLVGSADRLDLLRLLADVTVSLLDARLDARRWQEIAHRSRAQVDQYRLLLNSTSEGIFCIDRDGVCTFANAACTRMLGYHDHQSLLGKQLHDLIHHTRADGTPYPRQECPVMRAIAAHESVHLDNDRLWRADGSPLICEMWATPMLRGRELVGAVCAFVDVSARKQWEDELRHVVYLRERFVSMLAHDLRNPLQAIAMSIGVLGAGTNPARRRAVGVIRSAAMRMQRMIASLLDLARTRGGAGIQVQPQLADMNDICRRVIDEHKASTPGREIRLHEAANAAGLWDPDRLEQAVANLVGNALKFSPEETPIDIWVIESGDTVTVTVRNEGEPIPQHEIAEIFNPFRVATTQPRDGSSAGLGLGLFIVQETVKAHGGRVSVDSTAQKGTVFTMSLPRYGTGLLDALHPPA